METPPPENLSAAIQELIRGQESANLLRRLLFAQQVKGEAADLVAGAQQVSAEVLVGDVLRSFTNILSVLNSGEVFQVPVVSDSYCVKSEESEESSKSSAPRDRRGCYKRRKGSDSITRLTSNLTDDGYQWRKYGQKAIQSTNYPRNYFRCTYKTDHGCPATKQVQMISSNPPMYQTVYHGEHTCKTLKTPQIILDCPSPTIDDSSFLVSFKTDSKNVKPEMTKEDVIILTTPNTQNYPISSSDSSNYYLPSLTEVHSSTSYCSFGDSDLVDLQDVISYY